MNCPTCNVPLVMSERQGVEIDYCPTCRGVWLDRGELDKILERSVQPAGNTRQNDQTVHYGKPQQHYTNKKQKSWLQDIFD